MVTATKLSPIGIRINQLIVATIKRLLRARDMSPDATSTDKLLYCYDMGCVHRDGFIATNAYTKNVDGAGRVARTPVAHVNCPNLHTLTFCERCRDFESPAICGSEFSDMDEETLRLVRHNSKPCPTCRILITKTDGCNHMTCSGCEQHFCWTCLTTFLPTMGWESHAPCNNVDVYGDAIAAWAAL